MNKDEFMAIAAENARIRDEVMETLAPAFGVTSIRHLARLLGANVKTVLTVLENPDRFQARGGDAVTGRPSTGGASAYDVVHSIQHHAKVIDAAGVLDRVATLIEQSTKKKNRPSS